MRRLSRPLTPAEARAPARPWASRAALGLAALAGLALGACSLGNLQRVDCSSDAQCASLFGAGSRCDQGYCTSATRTDCTAPGADGRPCFHCTPTAPDEIATACTSASCQPFDDKRLTKLTADGGLPPLP